MAVAQNTKLIPKASMFFLLISIVLSYFLPFHGIKLYYISIHLWKFYCFCTTTFYNNSVSILIFTLIFIRTFILIFIFISIHISIHIVALISTLISLYSFRERLKFHGSSLSLMGERHIFQQDVFKANAYSSCYVFSLIGALSFTTPERRALPFRF